MDAETRRLAQTGAEEALARLLERLDEPSVADIDPRLPSRLPGWTIGHVLTHVARNADSMTRVFVAGGEPTARYPPGVADRDADIAAGSDRPLAALVADVRESGDRLATAWRDYQHWESARSIEAAGHDIPASDLPMMRWREVEVHAVDLGLGIEPTDWPGLFVRLELRAMDMRWRARRPTFLAGLPAVALALDPPTRLAWLYGRVEVPDLPPAGLL